MKLRFATDGSTTVTNEQGQTEKLEFMTEDVAKQMLTAGVIDKKKFECIMKDLVDDSTEFDMLFQTAVDTQMKQRDDAEAKRQKHGSHGTIPVPSEIFRGIPKTELDRVSKS